VSKCDLTNEITKILILSHYETETNGNHGTTAQEVKSFEQRAMDKYLGKSDDPRKIIMPIFHARVQHTVALILRAIDHHLSQEYSEWVANPGDYKTASEIPSIEAQAATRR
jgi:hypothetical protein